jgi:hypothetical protein
MTLRPELASVLTARHWKCRSAHLGTVAQLYDKERQPDGSHFSLASKSFENSYHTCENGSPRNDEGRDQERSILEQSDRIPQSSLYSAVTTRHFNWERFRKFFIHQPEIDRGVCDFLQDRGQNELWNVAYALRHLRQSNYSQDLEFILESVEEIIRLELKDVATSRVTAPNDQNATQEWIPRILYSVIMLSYGAEATLSRNGQSHSAHLEHVVLVPCDSVTLVFNRVGKDDSYHHHFPVSDLPRLGNYGIELDLGPFRKFLSDQESSKNTTYGCTFSKCFDKFQKESGWRKHEALQDFQPECWPCALYALGIKSPLFYKPAVFKGHLRSYHAADAEEIALQIERQRIGRDCRSRF